MSVIRWYGPIIFDQGFGGAWNSMFVNWIKINKSR
jgi:hypothetical protein